MVSWEVQRHYLETGEAKGSYRRSQIEDALEETVDGLGGEVSRLLDKVQILDKEGWLGHRERRDIFERVAENPLEEYEAASLLLISGKSEEPQAAMETLAKGLPKENAEAFEEGRDLVYRLAIDALTPGEMAVLDRYGEEDVAGARLGAFARRIVPETFGEEERTALLWGFIRTLYLEENPSMVDEAKGAVVLTRKLKERVKERRSSPLATRNFVAGLIEGSGAADALDAFRGPIYGVVGPDLLSQREAHNLASRAIRDYIREHFERLLSRDFPDREQIREWVEEWVDGLPERIRLRNSLLRAADWLRDNGFRGVSAEKVFRSIHNSPGPVSSEEIDEKHVGGVTALAKTMAGEYCDEDRPGGIDWFEPLPYLKFSGEEWKERRREIQDGEKGPVLLKGDRDGWSTTKYGDLVGQHLFMEYCPVAEVSEKHAPKVDREKVLENVLEKFTIPPGEETPSPSKER